LLLSQTWKLYESDKKLLGYSIHTLKAYNIQINLLIKHFGDIDISLIEYINLKEYLITLTHLKPASVGHRIRFIHSLFRYLHEEGFIEKNISSKLKELKQGIRIPKAFNDEEIELYYMIAVILY